MKNRPSWCFVVGSYRSGSTTQYRLTADIVRETGNGIAIGYHTESKIKDKDSTDAVKAIAGQEGVNLNCERPIVVCKVFLPIFSRDCIVPKTDTHSYAVKIHDEDRLKAVCTVRNPLDIITSMKRRNEGRDEWDFNRTATEDLPKWLGDMEQWIDLGPQITHYSHFEDFTHNILSEVRAVSAHLGIDIDDGLAKTIAKRHTITGINEHKRRMRELGEREDKWLPSVPGIVFGTSNNWRTWLNGPEIKMTYESNRAFMERFGYHEP